MFEVVSLLKNTGVAAEETAASMLFVKYVCTHSYSHFCSLCVIWHKEPTSLPVFELLKEWLMHSLTMPDSAHTTALQGRLLIAFGTLVRFPVSNRAFSRNLLTIVFLGL